MSPSQWCCTLGHPRAQPRGSVLMPPAHPHAVLVPLTLAQKLSPVSSGFHHFTSPHSPVCSLNGMDLGSLQHRNGGTYFKQMQNGLTRLIQHNPPAPGLANVLGTVTRNNAVSKQGIITTVQHVLLVRWRGAEMDEEAAGAEGAQEERPLLPPGQSPGVALAAPSPPRAVLV